MADPARYGIDPLLILSADDQPTKAGLHIEPHKSGEWIKWNDFLDYKMAQRRNASLETNTSLGVEVAHLRAENGRLKERVAFLERADRFKIYNHDTNTFEVRFAEPT